MWRTQTPAKDVVSVSHEHVILHSCMFEADLKTLLLQLWEFRAQELLSICFSFELSVEDSVCSASHLRLRPRLRSLRPQQKPIAGAMAGGRRAENAPRSRGQQPLRLQAGAAEAARLREAPGVDGLSPGRCSDHRDVVFGRRGAALHVRADRQRQDPHHAPRRRKQREPKERERLWIERHAVHELAALEIFGSDPAAVGVQFLELRGDKAFDLLANPEGPRAGQSA